MTPTSRCCVCLTPTLSASEAHCAICSAWLTFGPGRAGASDPRPEFRWRASNDGLPRRLHRVEGRLDRIEAALARGGSLP